MSDIGTPETCEIAFKEWAGVCRALAAGTQIIILRKGGIAEGPRGFEPEHASFWLFPTHLHEKTQGLKPQAAIEPVAIENVVPISTLLRVEALRRVDNPHTLESLDGEHVWTGETMRSRFEYRQPGLWLMIVRAFVAANPVLIRPTSEQSGCKSWVILDPPLETGGLTPVHDLDEFERRRERVWRALNRGPER